MVYCWIYACFYFLHPSLHRDRHLLDDTICLLYREWCLIQYRMGSHRNKSYEFGAFSDFRQIKKSNHVFIQDRLNNIRNAFTYLANLIVLVLGLVLFEVLSDPVIQFLIIALVAHILGILSSIFFGFHQRKIISCRHRKRRNKNRIKTYFNSYKERSGFRNFSH